MRLVAQRADPLRDEPTPERVLRVAIEVFAEKGYEGTTTREICRRAGVNGAALNYHFRSKEQLWQAVCSRSNDWLMSVVGSCVRTPIAPEQLLVDLVEGLFDAFVQHPEYARILVWTGMQADAMDFETTAQRFQPIVDLCFGYLRSLRDDGKLGGVDAEVVVSLLQGQLMYFFVDRAGYRRFFGKDLADADHAARVKRELVRAARLLLGNALSDTAPHQQGR